MNALEIPRVAIHEIHTVYEPLKDELFDRCRKTLGYDANSSTEWKRDSAILAAALKQACIDPLKLTTVKKYQSKMLWKVSHNSLRLFLHVFVALAFNVAFGYLTAWTFNPLTNPAHGIADYVFGYFACVTIEAIGLFSPGIVIWGPGKTWKWEATPLKGYDKPVPEFALAYALAIKNANPLVDLSIEELRSEQKVADPFLTASFGGRMYYIAVWDEPKFEGRKGK